MFFQNATIERKLSQKNVVITMIINVLKITNKTVLLFLE